MTDEGTRGRFVTRGGVTYLYEETPSGTLLRRTMYRPSRPVPPRRKRCGRLRRWLVAMADWLFLVVIGGTIAWLLIEAAFALADARRWW